MSKFRVYLGWSKAVAAECINGKNKQITHIHTHEFILGFYYFLLLFLIVTENNWIYLHGAANVVLVFCLLNTELVFSLSDDGWSCKSLQKISNFWHCALTLHFFLLFLFSKWSLLFRAILIRPFAFIWCEIFVLCSFCECFKISLWYINIIITHNNCLCLFFIFLFLCVTRLLIIIIFWLQHLIW